ncbi:hypothetical protein AAFC00_003967 [Neodothiora populina]|uniref:FAD-binding FR-type domain-containing protein n=1 Tax=Neodothiora populina TaxID=2781224 RepID=A0ABR3PI44_9PEZI
MVTLTYVLLLAFAIFSAKVSAALKPTDPREFCFYANYQVLTLLKWSDGSSSAKAQRSIVSSGTFTNDVDDLAQADRRSIESRADAAAAATAGGKPKVAAYCANKAELTSMYASTKLYCSPQALEDGILFWERLCESVNATLDLSTIQAVVTNEYIAKLPIVDPDTGIKNVTGPAVLLESYFDRSLKSYTVHANSKVLSKNLPWAIMGYWGGVLFLGILTNLFNIYVARRAATEDIEKSSSSPVLTPLRILRHWIRTYIVIPAAVGTFHQQRFMWCTIPKRLDSLIVFGWWALCIIISSTGYHAFSENIMYVTIAKQMWYWLPLRMGCLAAACLPWLWLFSGRNNIFIWATGWDFRTFNIFHRHVARAMVVFAIVHSIGYTVKYCMYSPGTYTTDWTENWFRMGAVALILASLILLSSTGWLRVNYYEIFLAIHITFAIAFLVSMFVHTTEVEFFYTIFLYPCVALWSFDRLVRLLRIAYCNIHINKTSLIKMSNAIASYNAEEDVIRLDVYPAFNAAASKGLMGPKGGQYYHIYQPFAWKGWENHTFTLAGWSYVHEAEQRMHLSSASSSSDDMERGVVGSNQHGSPMLSSADEKMPRQSTAATETSNDDENRERGQLKLTFWIRPYDGWTRRIRDSCLSASAQSASASTHLKLLLEGPYTKHSPLASFDSVIFITGGTGISAALAYITELSEHQEQQRQYGKTTRTQKVQLHMSAKQPAFLRRIAREELQSRESGLEAKFYCTGCEATPDSPALLTTKSSASSTSSCASPPSPPSVCKETEKPNPTTATGLSDAIEPCLQVSTSPRSSTAVSREGNTDLHRSRPDIHSIISTATHEALAQQSSPSDEEKADRQKRTRIAVLVCGPAAMADEARDAVRGELERIGGGTTGVWLEYFEDVFGW